MDTVADALIRLKNGYVVGKTTVKVKYSKLILEICRVLEKEGYITSFKPNGYEIDVVLRYNNKLPALTQVKRISKPGLRVYKGAKALPTVLNGLGIAIISTPKGVMTNKQAKHDKLGGEILVEIW